MFEQLFGNLVEEYREPLNKAGISVQAYAERVLARLEDINASVSTEEFVEQRRVIPVTLTAGIANAISLGRVPTDSEWLIETVAVSSAGAGGVLIGPDPRSFTADTNGWIQTTRLAAPVVAGLSQIGGNNVLFQGGEEPFAWSNGAAVSITIQLKVKSRKPTSKAKSAGTADPAADQGNENRSGRHTGPPVGTAPRVTGDRYAGLGMS